jgi:hypothetical protein
VSISLYRYAKTQHASCLFRELRAGLHVDAATELLPHNRVLFRVDSMPTSAASPCMHEGGTAAPTQLALAFDSSRRCRSTAPRRLCIHRSQPRLTGTLTHRCGDLQARLSHRCGDLERGHGHSATVQTSSCR